MREIEKSQREYEKRLRCFLKKKQERLRIFLETAPKGTQAEHDFDIRLVRAIQNTDELDFDQLQNLGIHINKDLQQLG